MATNLERPAPSKDIWDRFATVSPLITGLAVALVGAMFTGIYSLRQAEMQRENQTHQNRILAMQTIEKFLPYLTSENESLQRAAVLALGEFSELEAAGRISAMFNTQGARAATDALMAQSSPTDQVSPPDTASTERISPTAGTAAQWIYLGKYSKSQSQWETRYLNFDPASSPESLVNRTLEVRDETGALNVREKPLGRITSAVRPNGKVRVVEIMNFAGVGYMWGRVEP